MQAIILSLLLAGTHERTPMTWDVDGLPREALVVLPDSAPEGHSPLVFVFHGHGGTAAQAARSFNLEAHWPEAVVVYPQGVPTPGQLTDPEGKRNGWQSRAGEQDDRDLKFFDAMLSTLREKHRVDDSRIYATGHSNGGSMTFLLWETRPEILAAVAPSASAAGRRRKLSPKPAIQIAGESDPLVTYAWQERTMQQIRELNHCDESGVEWAEHATLYPSQTGTPFVTVIHPGGHRFYAEASQLIVRFFKEQARQQ